MLNENKGKGPKEALEEKHKSLRPILQCLPGQLRQAEWVLVRQAMVGAFCSRISSQQVAFHADNKISVGTKCLLLRHQRNTTGFLQHQEPALPKETGNDVSKGKVTK